MKYSKIRTPLNTRGQNSKSVANSNHRKNNLAFFLGIVMLLLGIPAIKWNRSLAFILLALALVLVGFATMLSTSTGISQHILSTVNFTLPSGAILEALILAWIWFYGQPLPPHDVAIVLGGYSALLILTSWSSGK